MNRNHFVVVLVWLATLLDFTGCRSIVTFTRTTAATPSNVTPTIIPSPIQTPALSSTATVPPRPTPGPQATSVEIPTPLPGIQPVHDPGLVAAPLQVPADLRRGAFATAHTLNLPSGFHIAVFAAGLASPRGLAISPNGALYATLIGDGRVVALLNPGRTGTSARVVTVASGLNHPHGIAFANGSLYVGETNEVVRFQLSANGLQISQRTVVVPNLPADGGHSTRTVHVGPDGKLYVSIGSSCNVCVERDPRRAAIVRYNLDGSGEHIVARGLRNAVGFTFAPDTGLLWATVNGRDNLGDNLPGEDITVVQDGDNFGWPYCYGNRVPDPQYGTPQICRTMTEPTLQIQAHSAPLGAAFYTGTQFPASYQGNLFVSLHGSWNRSVPTGYKVVEVVMRRGQPKRVLDFAAGWLVGDSAWGRPVDVIGGPDGSLYVSDDTAGAIYRIWYDGHA